MTTKENIVVEEERKESCTTAVHCDPCTNTERTSYKHQDNKTIKRQNNNSVNIAWKLRRGII